MSNETVAALIAALEKDEALRERLSGAGGPAEFERLAAEAGFEVSAQEYMAASSEDLSDAELEGASGGYTFPPTDWIYCDNPWTNAWCTLKC